VNQDGCRNPLGGSRQNLSEEALLHNPSSQPSGRHMLGSAHPDSLPPDATHVIRNKGYHLSG